MCRSSIPPRADEFGSLKAGHPPCAGQEVAPVCKTRRRLIVGSSQAVIAPVPADDAGFRRSHRAAPFLP